MTGSGFSIEPFSLPNDRAAWQPVRRTGRYAFEVLELESPSGMPTLRQGSRGLAVTDLQRRLTAVGMSPGAMDGVFGSRTGSAVRSFQRSRGLQVDGVVGPQTWSALLAGVTVPGPAAPTVPYPSVPASGLRARMASVALQEWQRWGNGSIKESDPRMRPALEDYWRVATGAPPPSANWWEPYWSAVFISWVAHKAGAGSQFQYSSAHTDYVGAAKRNRLANNTNPFKAYRVGEMAPRLGDLVCAERSTSGVTYDNVDDGTFRSSHSDVVVEVESGRIAVIGGNVSNTVGRKTITLNAAGKLQGAPYYAVVRCGA